MTLKRDTRDPRNYPECSRCGRPNDPWMLQRPDTCSPGDWAWCIRDDSEPDRTVVRQTGPSSREW